MRSRRNIRNPARLRLETALSLQADLSLVSSMREKRTKRHPTAQKAPSRGTVASTLTVLSSLLARARLESDLGEGCCMLDWQQVQAYYIRQTPPDIARSRSRLCFLFVLEVSRDSCSSTHSLSARWPATSTGEMLGSERQVTPHQWLLAADTK